MTLVIGVISREGIAMAADRKCTLVSEWTDKKTGERKKETTGFVSTGDKLSGDR